VLRILSSVICNTGNLELTVSNSEPTPETTNPEFNNDTGNPELTVETGNFYDNVEVHILSFLLKTHSFYELAYDLFLSK